MFAASAYFHYEAPCFDSGRVRYGFYTSLPFGSSIAPANWGATCDALAWIMAYIVSALITSKIFAASKRIRSFGVVAWCSFSGYLIGLKLDMDKSLSPGPDFFLFRSFDRYGLAV